MLGFMVILILSRKLWDIVKYHGIPSGKRLQFAIETDHVQNS